jgi:ferredoxin--NADP+ reductase
VNSAAVQPNPVEGGGELAQSAIEQTKITKRAYSIGSSPEEKGALEFYVAVVEGGTLTPTLSTLTIGARLFCGVKPTGHFLLTPVPEEKNLVFVATGTGIAPFISMLRTSGTWTPGRHITLIHGVRWLRDLAYRDELLALQRQNPSFRYFAVVSREDVPEDIGYRGYAQHLFAKNIVRLDPHQDHVFMCGNPAMINDVEALLSPLGYQEHTKKIPGNLHFEKYW